ncbi:182 kDa tankyrase-1-binding protein isoform X2 [Carettochelys insculpta]|uniref:182 kDa tankyrase-1-binding protein isoform X2 n=1 Tax=Carettochelys insculpta TaxID=44489 RepID=UPI003EC0F520
MGRGRAELSRADPGSRPSQRAGFSRPRSPSPLRLPARRHAAAAGEGLTCAPNSSSLSPRGATMASQPQPLCPPPPCAAANGGVGGTSGQLMGSPEAGDALLKPPVRPKPRTLPKPALPAKPCVPPPPSPGTRAPRLEFPSAAKINLLAGPKPYGGSSTALKRLSFSLKGPSVETSNGKGPPLPAARAPPCAPEEGSPALVTHPAGGSLGVLKGAAPFKVKAVVAKPECFPGTTVEEILAKMERPRAEGLGSPDPAWGLCSTFSLDAGSRFGPKGFTAFRRQPSAEGGEGSAVAPGLEALQESGPPEAEESGPPCRTEPVAGERKRDGSPSPNGHHLPDREAQRDPGPASRESGSSPAGASYDGDQSGRRRSPSPPGFSSTRIYPVPAAPADLPLGAAPGSPSSSASLAQVPGAPCLPASAPGAPAMPAELPTPGSPLVHAEPPPGVRAGSPGTPESLAKDSISLAPAPGAPCAPAEPCHSVSHAPGSPETPGEGSPPSCGLPAGLAPGLPDSPPELPHSPPVGQPSAPGPLDALAELPCRPSAGQPPGPGPTESPTEIPHSPPVGQPLAPGPLVAPAELSPTIARSPGAPEASLLSPDTPSLSLNLSGGVSQSPGSPDGPAGALRSPDSPPPAEQGSPLPPGISGTVPTDEGVCPPQQGPRRSSDGVVQLPGKGLRMGELGGSLAALPWGGPPDPGQPLAGESNWSLSQSFEWAFPSRAVEWVPPRSPIREADDSGLSDQGKGDGESPVPSPEGSDGGSGSQGLRPEHPSVALSWQDVEVAGSSAHPAGAPGAPCDQGVTKAGSPVEVGGSRAPEARRDPSETEPKGPGAVDAAATICEEQSRLLPEPEPGRERAAPVLLPVAPWPAGAKVYQEDDLAGSCQEDLRPGEAVSELHRHARWLDELLASPPPSADETKRKDAPEPREPAGPEDLLGWSRKDLCSEFGIRGAHQAGEFGWASEPGTGDTDWPGSYGAGETEQDREFGTGSRDWGGTYNETALLRDSSVGPGNWPDAYSMGDSSRRDEDFSPDWSNQYKVGGAENPDGEFHPRTLGWTSPYSIGECVQRDEKFGTGEPDWPHEPGVGDTAHRDREFSASQPDWPGPFGLRYAAHQGEAFGVEKPDWAQESSGKADGPDREWASDYGVGSPAQPDEAHGADRPDWSQQFGAGDGDRQDASSPDKLAWLGEYTVHRTDPDSALGSSPEEPASLSQEPGAEQPRWSGADWQESKFPFARRDSAGDVRIQAAEYESQFGVIGTERAGGFGSAPLDPPCAIQPLGPAGLGENQADWAGRSGPREAGVGQADWTGELGLPGTAPSVSLRALSPEEHGGGWMDWTDKLHTSTGVEGVNPPREPGVGQSAGASDLGAVPGSGLGSLGSVEARLRQANWSCELLSESSAKTGEAVAGHMDWASEAGIGPQKQPSTTAMAGLEPPGDSDPISAPLSGPSPLLEEMLAKAGAQCRSPREERGLPAAPGPHYPPSPREADVGLRLDGDGAPSPADAVDGGWLSREDRRLSQASLPGEDFGFLEETEVLDSTVYRSRANLGRKRGHRAPALRPPGTWELFEEEAADWRFRDSTEPRAVSRASSDEEVAEEPQNRRARPSPASKGVKVPLFPGLNPSALKAKLRGRNRSVEEGAPPGEAKPARAKEPQVQRSKSCKIPGLGGKPLVLPPKPEKSSGSEAASPHWLQALKLKKKRC